MIVGSWSVLKWRRHDWRRSWLQADDQVKAASAGAMRPTSDNFAVDVHGWSYQIVVIRIASQAEVRAELIGCTAGTMIFVLSTSLWVNDAAQRVLAKELKFAQRLWSAAGMTLAITINRITNLRQVAYATFI